VVWIKAGQGLSFQAWKLSVRANEVVSSSDPQGRVALMLCEILLHVLVEEGVLTKAKAIEAVETVVELTREMADANPGTEPHIAVNLVQAIAESFALKD
jgi:hypothetical protein